MKAMIYQYQADRYIRLNLFFQENALQKEWGYCIGRPLPCQQISHLAAPSLLVEVGLVTARKEGRNRYYRLHDDGTARLQTMFDTFWGNKPDLP